MVARKIMNSIIGNTVKKGYRHIIHIMLSLMGVVLLGSCSADSADAPQQPNARSVHDLYISPYSQLYTDVTPVGSHRALPSGYVVYDELNPMMRIADTQIHCFLTHTRVVDFKGDFIYNGSSSWFSKVPLDEGDYYVYGYMPSSQNGTVTVLDPSNESVNYSQGAIITFDGMNAVSASDLCVIVGVLGAQDNVTPIDEMNMKLGNFKYNADTEGDYIYLLMNHLYSALQFHFIIDSNYRQLRRIKLTKMELQATTSATTTVKATLTPNDNGTSPLSVTQTEHAGTGQWVTIYEGAEQELDVITPLEFVAFAAPGANNKTFNLKTTYNVYDRNNNLIRKRTAENKLTLSFADTEKTTLAAGEKHTFNLTVNPTYLYVLSDPDLDNPTVTVSN